MHVNLHLPPALTDPILGCCLPVLCLQVGAAAPALAADMTVAPSPAAVVAGQPSSSKMSPGVAAPSGEIERSHW